MVQLTEEPVESVAAIAKKHGLDQSYLARILEGKRLPSLAYSRRLAVAFGVTLVELLYALWMDRDEPFPIAHPEAGTTEFGHWKFSLTKLSADLEMDPSHILRILRGKVPPSIPQLFSLSGSFRMGVEEFLQVVGADRTSTPVIRQVTEY